MFNIHFSVLTNFAILVYSDAFLTQFCFNEYVIFWAWAMKNWCWQKIDLIAILNWKYNIKIQLTTAISKNAENFCFQNLPEVKLTIINHDLKSTKNSLEKTEWKAFHVPLFSKQPLEATLIHHYSSYLILTKLILASI